MVQTLLEQFQIIALFPLRFFSLDFLSINLLLINALILFNYILIQNKELNVIGHTFNINSICSENSSLNNAQDGAMDNHSDDENRSSDSSGYGTEYGTRLSDPSEPTEGFLQLEREREEGQGSLDEGYLSSRSIDSEQSILDLSIDSEQSIVDRFPVTLDVGESNVDSEISDSEQSIDRSIDSEQSIVDRFPVTLDDDHVINFDVGESNVDSEISDFFVGTPSGVTSRDRPRLPDLNQTTLGDTESLASLDTFGGPISFLPAVSDGILNLEEGQESLSNPSIHSDQRNSEMINRDCANKRKREKNSCDGDILKTVKKLSRVKKNIEPNPETPVPETNAPIPESIVPPASGEPDLSSGCLDILWETLQNFF